jgi:hypothetical protein
MPFEVAIVSRDPATRMAAARAFDAAPADWRVVLVEEAPAHADAVVYGYDAAAEGGIVFDPARPGDALTSVRASAARPAPHRTVTVVGAVGGAGATVLALHLAAEWGPGTCCAELRRSGVGAWLDLPPESRTWSPGEDGPPALPVRGGYRVLLAPSPGPGAAAFPLASVRDAFERVVVDAATERDLTPLLDDVGILVTPPTRPGARAARAVLDAFPDARWAVVANRAGPGGQIMRAGLEELIGRPLALELPCCPALRDAEDQARLLSSSRHRWRRRVTRLARALDAC